MIYYWRQDEGNGLENNPPLGKGESSDQEEFGLEDTHPPSLNWLPPQDHQQLSNNPDSSLAVIHGLISLRGLQVKTGKDLLSVYQI